jgi:hypothetical protein
VNRQGHHYVYYRCGRRRHGYPTCTAPAPREEKITDDIRDHLGRLALPKPLVHWTLGAIEWWANEQKLELRGLANGRTAELEKARGQIKRLTDLAVAGAIAEDEFVRRRGELQSRAESLERDVKNPLADLERWKQTVLEALEVGAGALQAFDSGPTTQRRDLLGRLYVNLLVTDRNTTPELHFPFLVLEKAPISPTTDSGGDVNLPPPHEYLSAGRYPDENLALPRNSVSRATDGAQFERPKCTNERASRAQQSYAVAVADGASRTRARC